MNEMKNEDFSSAFSAETRQHTYNLERMLSNKPICSPSLG